MEVMSPSQLQIQIFEDLQQDLLFDDIKNASMHTSNAMEPKPCQDQDRQTTDELSHEPKSGSRGNVQQAAVEREPALARKKMANGDEAPFDTLDSNDTQALPSQFYQDYIDSKSTNTGASILPENAKAAHGSEEGTYETGETGHINLVGDYDESQLGPPAYYNNEDEEDELGEDTQMREGVVTSPTILSPVTPGIAGSKRDRQGNVVRFASVTPAQDYSAIFPNAQPNPPMGLSQVFQDTQAVSSPPVTSATRGGYVFDRPSPDFVSGAPGSPQDEESPVMTRRQPLVRATTEPKGNYITMKESQERRRQEEKRRREIMGTVDDDDKLSQDIMAQKARVRRKKDNIAKEFKSGKFSFMDPTSPKRQRLSNKFSSGNPPIVKTPVNRKGPHGNTVLISDDTPRPFTVDEDVLTDEDPKDQESNEASNLGSVGHPHDDQEDRKLEEDSDAESVVDFHEFTQEVIEGPCSSARKSRDAREPSQPMASPFRRHVHTNHDTRVCQSFPTTGHQHGTWSGSQHMSWHGSLSSPYNQTNHGGHYTMSQSVQIPRSQLPPRSQIQRSQMPPRPTIVASSVDSRQYVNDSQQDYTASNNRRPQEFQQLDSNDEISSDLPIAPSQVSYSGHNRDEEEEVIAASMPSSPPVLRSAVKGRFDSLGTTDIKGNIEADDVDELGEPSQSFPVPRPSHSPLSSEHVSRVSISSNTPSRKKRPTPVPRSIELLLPDNEDTPRASGSVSNSAMIFHTAPTQQSKPNWKLKPVRPRPEQIPESPVIPETTKPEVKRRSKYSRMRPPSNEPDVPDGDPDIDPLNMDVQIFDEEDQEFAALIGVSSPIERPSKRRKVLSEPSTEENRLPRVHASYESVSESIENKDIGMPTPSSKRGQRELKTLTENHLSPTGAHRSAEISSPTTSRLQNHDEDVVMDVDEPVRPIDVAANKPPRPQRQPPLNLQTEVAGTRRILQPNRVLAKFKDGRKDAYWPGTCIGVGQSGELVKVRFDDGNIGNEVLKGHVRSFELRKGDVVRVDMDGHRKNPYIISEVKARPPLSLTGSADVDTDIYGSNTVVVIPKKAGNDSTRSPIEVSLSRIYITTNLLAQFNDRQFTYVKSAVAERLQTPITGMSAPTTPSSRGRRRALTAVPQPTSLAAPSVEAGIFSNMAFAISISGKLDNVRGFKSNSTDLKYAMSELIRRNGGTVLQDGFHNLFESAGTLLPHAATPESSAFTDADLGLTEFSTNLGFVALIADTHSRSEKYMLALALDLPCLSSRWVRDSIAQDRVLPWQRYLLPAGECSLLNGAIRSRTFEIPSVDASTAILKQTVSQRSKLFRDKNILLVVGNKREEEKRKIFAFLTQALGARRVERVESIGQARKILLESACAWDWVYVDDKDIESASGDLAKKGNQGIKRKRKNGLEAEGVGGQFSTMVEVDGRTVRVVGDEFVIQSLILGALIDED